MSYKKGDEGRVKKRKVNERRKKEGSLERKGNEMGSKEERSGKETKVNERIRKEGSLERRGNKDE